MTVKGFNFGRVSREKKTDVKAKAQTDKDNTVAELVVGNTQRIYSPAPEISL